MMLRKIARLLALTMVTFSLFALFSGQFRGEYMLLLGAGATTLYGLKNSDFRIIGACVNAVLAVIGVGLILLAPARMSEEVFHLRQMLGIICVVLGTPSAIVLSLRRFDPDWIDFSTIGTPVPATSGFWRCNMCNHENALVLSKCERCHEAKP